MSACNGKPRGTPGTVSWGTMRPEDLIPRFVDTLKELHCQDSIVKEAEAIEDFDNADAEDLDAILDYLFEHLSEHAPKGCYFGAHEGDGADYGFWAFESEDE